MYLSPINYQQKVISNNNINFEAKKAKIIKMAADTAKTSIEKNGDNAAKILVPSALALTSLTIANKSKSSLKNDNEEQPKLTGIPDNLEDMRARFPQPKRRTRNAVTAELENALIISPMQVESAIYFKNADDLRDADKVKIYKISSNGLQTGLLKDYSVHGFSERGIHENFYNHQGNMIGYNSFFDTFSEICRYDYNNKRIVTKHIDNKTGKTEEYNVQYYDDFGEYFIRFNPDGKVYSISGNIKLKDGEDVDICSSYEKKVKYDNGNIILDTGIQHGRKFLINMEGTGKINSIEEIPCTEKYYEELIAKKPEFEEPVKHYNRTGPYDLNKFAKKILKYPKCTKILQEAKKSDGSRRFSDHEIIQLALNDPDYGTRKFLDYYYYNSNEDANTCMLWLSKCK